MSGRNETTETEETNRDTHERKGFSSDGGVVATTSTAITPGGDVQQPSVGDEEPQEDDDSRTERARTEEMDVSLLRKGGVYEVQSESGNTYEADVASKTCTCPDFTKCQPSGGCKHLRRVDIQIHSGTVPRPNGRLPATAAVTERLAAAVHDLDREIEEREAKRQELRTTLDVLEDFSG